VLRWLVPLVTIVVLLGRGVTTFAAAGITLDVKCCCPDPKTCKCHHDGGERSTMKKCSGAFHQIAPEHAATTLPEAPAPTLVPRATQLAMVTLPQPIDAPAREPETPPF
jgi:hypothetical protein